MTIVVISVSSTAPVDLPAVRGFRRDQPPRFGPRQRTLIGANIVEFISDTINSLPSQGDVDAYLAAQAAAVIESTRLSDILAAIAGTTVGGVTPQTLAQLSMMTRDQFNTWWTANITTNAQAIGALKLVAWLLLLQLRLKT